MLVGMWSSPVAASLELFVRSTPVRSSQRTQSSMAQGVWGGFRQRGLRWAMQYNVVLLIWLFQQICVGLYLVIFLATSTHCTLSASAKNLEHVFLCWFAWFLKRMHKCFYVLNMDSAKRLRIYFITRMRWPLLKQKACKDAHNRFYPIFVLKITF